jgi:hypothetical protein
MEPIPSDYTTVPTFGLSSTKTDPTSKAVYSSGFLEGEQMPFDYFNWFLNGLTENGASTLRVMLSLIKEMDNFLVAEGVTPDSSLFTQFQTALNTKIQSNSTYQIFSALPSVYPNGVSWFSVTTGNADGWPENVGTVMTIKAAANTQVFQIFVNQSSTPYFRASTSSSNWSTIGKAYTTTNVGSGWSTLLGLASTAVFAGENALGNYNWAGSSYNLNSVVGTSGNRVIVYSSNTVNAPHDNSGICLSMCFSATAYLQLAFRASGNGIVYYRYYWSGTWGSWNEFLAEGATNSADFTTTGTIAANEIASTGMIYAQNSAIGAKSGNLLVDNTISAGYSSIVLNTGPMFITVIPTSSSGTIYIDYLTSSAGWVTIAQSVTLNTSATVWAQSTGANYRVRAVGSAAAIRVVRTY